MQDTDPQDNGTDTARISAVAGTGLLDTPPEPRFDRLTRMTRELLGARAALLGLVDGERVWFKSAAGLERGEVARRGSFCDAAIREDRLFQVPDARTDPRFQDNPLVTGTLESDTPHTYEYALEFPDGTRAFEAHMARLSRDEVLLISRNVTRQRANARCIRESERRLTAVIEGTRSGAWEWNPQTGEMVVNDRWGESLGYTLEELRPVSIRTWRDLVHPDDLPRADAMFARHFAGEVPHYEIRYRMRHRNGSWVWIQDRGRISAWSENGTPLLVSGAHIDVTEQVESGRLAGELLRRLQKLAAHLPGMIYEFRQWPDGHYSFPYASEGIRDIYGVTAEQVRETVDLVLDLLLPEEIDDVMASIRHSAETLTPWRKQYWIRHPSGHLLWVEGHATPERLPDGGTLWYGYIADITERKLAEKARLDQARYTQAVIENLVDGIITTEGDGTIKGFNAAAERMFGYREADILGRNVSLLMPEPQARLHDDYMGAYRQTGIARIIGRGTEVEGRRRDGSTFPMELTISEIEYQGEPVFVGLVRDITRRKAAEQEINTLAFYDPLTGLPNRRLLLDRLAHALAYSNRSGRFGALLFIDLDHFKDLNDTAGHSTGDLLLQQVAERLEACVREDDSVGRLGGDEFVVILEGLSEERQAASGEVERIAGMIRSTLLQPYMLAERSYQGTPSLGVVLFLGHAETVDELLKQADLAMYQAKAAGRDTVRFFDPRMQATLMARAALESDLRGAIRNEQLVLHFQRQVNHAGLTLGAEALIRWHHPDRGIVPPADFIPLAEETGLILEIGQWVLTTACRQLARWAQSPHTADLTIAVNISARQFRHPDFVADVLATLENTGANPARLHLELTESLMVADVQEAIEKMSLLRARGVEFSLDDFGTGYSSLNYLKLLPLERLKIDQGFVRDILVDSNDATIARTIVALADSLGLAVIAEGVETEEQRQALAEMGCLTYQGYLYGRPAPVEDTPALRP